MSMYHAVSETRASIQVKISERRSGKFRSPYKY